MAVQMLSWPLTSALQSMAFRDVNPVSPVHILVIPRKPIPMLSQAGEDDTEVNVQFLP